MVLAEAILLLRGISRKSAAAHRGEWLKTANNSFEIRGKTLGIVGYGSIGSQLSVLAESLGMQVISMTPRPNCPSVTRDKSRA